MEETRPKIPFEKSWVQIPRKLLQSPIYIRLGIEAKAIIPYLLEKVRVSEKDRPQEYYSTPFNFTYTEAEKKGFTWRRLSKALKSLAAAGIIELVKTGGLKGKGKASSVFRLSKMWESYHYQETYTTPEEWAINPQNVGL